MEKEFLPYAQALALKELGFDEPCMAQWNDSNGFDGFGGKYRNSYFNYSDQIAAPTFSQAFRWFRKKYNVWCWIEKYSDKETYIYQIPKANFTKIQGYHNTYEEAELECLKKLIEIVKEN